MTEQEYRENIDREISGAENAVRKMLLYYISALQATGIEDVKQYIATRIGEIIDLSEDQCKFITLNFQQHGKIVQSLENGKDLLEKMEQNKVYDAETVSIVKQTIELVLKDLEDFKVDFNMDNNV